MLQSHENDNEKMSQREEGQKNNSLEAQSCFA